MAVTVGGAPLPSLVADDLVELARRSLSGFDSPVRLELPDGGPAPWPGTSRPAALDFALMELLLEIRDGLRHDHLIRAEPFLAGLEAVLRGKIVEGGWQTTISGVDDLTEILAAAVRAFVAEELP